MTVLIALADAASQLATATLEVDISGLRNRRGILHACLTSNGRLFPDCARDRKATKVTVPANFPRLRFSGSVPGS